MPICTGISGKNYIIADKPFAGGGEGDIFDIIATTSLVAKIYKIDKRTRERERKLTAMMKIKPSVIDQYAWPLDVLYENGKFAGYIMPKVVGKEKLRNIYVYDKRKDKPWTLYIAIAKNLASAVYNVHEIGQTIGDLNPENILVNPQTGLVTLVDIDSYHITDVSGQIHRCGVGMPEYVAPELQGKHFPSASLPTFTKETDLFSLSVFIFSLLMNGAHPFACKTISGSASSFQPIDNMSNGICAYFAKARVPGIDIPKYAPAIESLPKVLQELFSRTFVDGHKNPRLRPSAKEYYYALETLENNIKVCGANSEHQYYYYALECPWCKVDQKMGSIGQAAYSSGTISSVSGSGTGSPAFISGSGVSGGHPFPLGPTYRIKKVSWWKSLPGIATLSAIAIIIVLAMGYNGAFWSWAGNEYGQFVDGTTTDWHEPEQLSDGTTTDWHEPAQIVTDSIPVIAGWAYTLVISNDKTLWAWGRNGDGQLGDGTTETRLHPVQVLTDVVSVAAGGAHSLAITTDGTLWAWGRNGDGQLGDGTTITRLHPVPVLTDVISIAVGGAHSLAITSDGTLWAWGENEYGQIGDGTTVPSPQPIPVLTDVVSATARGDHSLAITSDGTLWAWGRNGDGQLGDGTTITRLHPVPVLTDVISVAAGGTHVLAIRSDGTLWVWGGNEYGQLGDGTTITRLHPVPVLTDVISIAVGGAHSLAIRSDGTLWAWGGNEFGQLGDGTTLGSVQPIQILTGMVSVTARGWHSLAIGNDGSVWAWGRNEYGQLGDGTTTDRHEPVRVL